ncbi:MAG: hypothetical protein FJ387_27780 [Verrucomicrobia bacterium]|nr:hypothetical protein [Verrucomicrobiota bacterium]
MRWWQASARWLATVRHLAPGQVWCRGARLLRRRWDSAVGRRLCLTHRPALAAVQPLLAGLTEVAEPGPWTDEVRAACGRAEAAARLEFSFLNVTARYATQPDWQDATQSRLWRYHLHGFEYAMDLLVWHHAGGAPAAYAAFRRLAESWIEGNARVGGDGWHPYTVSLRLVQWLHAAYGFAPELDRDPEFRARWLAALYDQARFLRANLEFDVRGNHLLENLRALAWAGLCFQGSEARSWFEAAVRHWRKEQAEQILEDGGHFERNPGYHVVVLRLLLELATFCRRNQHPCAAEIEPGVERAARFLKSLLAPELKLPLLKDTTVDGAQAAESVLAAAALCMGQAQLKASASFGLYPLLLFGRQGWAQYESWPTQPVEADTGVLPQSGFYILRDVRRRDHLVWDAGDVCPDYLPAHAHADMFSYELVVAGLRVVVDSGVYEYAPGAWRDYFRSTRAHNTVEIGGEDQSEVWHSFRVGRRARPTPVSIRRVQDAYLLEASHNGYRHLPGKVQHRRAILWRPGAWWVIADHVLGHGQVPARSLLHFHPACTVKEVANSIWSVQRDDVTVWVTAMGHSTSELTAGQTEPRLQGWYSERFGVLTKNPTLTLGAEHTAPYALAYGIAPDRGLTLARSDRGGVLVGAGDWSYPLD